ncbi:hypothetical protein [Paenibacillus sp. JJ-223]|uniref:hypothetical protein n=1 Tax=Paenibacillus sp. JJ-223 TaxID=2905647 RepID=UPI001F2D1D90|nr:hypothetical protein [Paenibacillus sp. JJ-223]CAH1225023.1 hypothetical protein PAECIP111890_05724 [Paenibacillus sp. JJ-223]
MEYLKQAINRISVIDWSCLGEKETMSQSHLCREYLRRATKFLKEYPGTCVPPFIMISNSITKPHENIEVISILDEINNSYHRALVTSYLELCALIDEKNPIAIDNKDLFEPAIKLYERGGFFHRREGYIYINGNAILIANVAWDKQEPLDISDETLEALDNGYIE